MVDVSVVITTYGRYNYIGEAIESVLKQTLKPREIVVVADDPDKVPYKDKVYVVEARDRKYGTAIIRGVNATTSDAIAILDDDDKLHPDKLRVVTRILERHPEVTAIHNNQAYIDVNGKPISDNDPRVRVYVEGQPEFPLLLSKYNALQWFRKYEFLAFNNSSLTVRRGIFERHKRIIENVELSMDSALFILSVNDGHYLHIPTKLTAYRIGSSTTNMDAWNDPVRVKRRLCIEIRHAHDYYILHNYVRDPMLRRVIEGSSLGYVLIIYWRFRSFVDCGVEVPLTTVDALRYALKQLGRVYNPPSFIDAMLAISTVLLGLSELGRRWLTDFSIRMHYGVNLASLIQSQRD